MNYDYEDENRPSYRDVTKRSLESRRLLKEIDELVNDNYIVNEEIFSDDWRDHGWDYFLDTSGRERDWIIIDAHTKNYTSALRYCLNTINILRFVAYHLQEEIKKE